MDSSQAIHAAIPLASLAATRCAVVTAMPDDPTLAARLTGLGLGEGRLVEVVRNGDPLIVRACGARIGLARGLAEAMRVRPCDHACETSPDAAGEGGLA